MRSYARTRKVHIVWFLALALAAGPAHAQPRPWHDGVNPEEKKRALELFQQGVTNQTDGRFSEAIEDYRRALQRWSHPAIHANMAILLAHQDEPVSAYRHMSAALRYGRGALESQVFENLVLRYQPRLRNQVSELRVQCGPEGTQISFDGEPICKARAEAKRYVTPGRHVLVASRAGRTTVTRPLVLLPGKLRKISVDLPPQQRWPVWVPWTIVGAAAAAGISSGVLHERALSFFGRFNRAVASCPSQGCPLEVAELRASGIPLMRGAIVGYVFAGLGLLVGAVLTYLNIPRAALTLQQDDQKTTLELPLLGRLGRLGRNEISGRDE